MNCAGGPVVTKSLGICVMTVSGDTRLSLCHKVFIVGCGETLDSREGSADMAKREGRWNVVCASRITALTVSRTSRPVVSLPTLIDCLGSAPPPACGVT